MKRIDVDSDVIHAIGYDAERRILEVQCHETGTYRYYEVEPETVAEFLDAESKGQYFKQYRPRTLTLVSWSQAELDALRGAGWGYAG